MLHSLYLSIKQNTKGAPLVEYIILLAFISILSLLAVQHLGEEVEDIFEVVEDVLPDTDINTDPDTDTPQTPEPLPPGSFSFPIPEDGHDVTITIEEAFPNGIPARFSATGAYSVPYQERWPESEDNNGAIAGISLGFSVYWLLNNGQKATIIGDSETQTGGGTATAHDDAINRTIPTRAIGISIEPYLSCGGGSTCFPGTFDFSISAPD